jgi:predicted transcriptional regulator
MTEDRLAIDRLLQRVARRARAVGKSRLADAAGVRESSIRKIGRDDWDPRASTLRKLERATKAAQAQSREAVPS